MSIGAAFVEKQQGNGVNEQVIEYPPGILTKEVERGVWRLTFERLNGALNPGWVQALYSTNWRMSGKAGFIYPMARLENPGDKPPIPRHVPYDYPGDPVAPVQTELVKETVDMVKLAQYDEVAARLMGEASPTFEAALARIASDTEMPVAVLAKLAGAIAPVLLAEMRGALTVVGVPVFTETENGTLAIGQIEAKFNRVEGALSGVAIPTVTKNPAPSVPISTRATRQAELRKQERLTRQNQRQEGAPREAGEPPVASPTRPKRVPFAPANGVRAVRPPSQTEIDSAG